MAKVTITITDIDLDAGEYKVDFHAEGNELSAGTATAAYFTAYYLYTISDSELMIEGSGRLAEEIVRMMDAEGGAPYLSPEVPATAYFVLEDADLTTGRYDTFLNFSGGHPEGDRLPSSAIAVALHMRALLGSINFQLDCWNFAAEFVERTGGTIANMQFAPPFGDAAAA